MKKYLSIFLLPVLTGLVAGCANLDSSPDAISGADNILIQLSVDAPTADSETQPNAEDAIHTLRVYAFRGQKQVGSYFLEDAVPLADGTIHFWMNLQIPSYSDPCDVVFYLIANEQTLENASPTLAGASFFEESVSRTTLDAYTFTALRYSTEMLPMSACETVTVNPMLIKGEHAVEGHEGHLALSEQLNFSLRRCVGKLELYFAKESSRYGLHIRSATILPAGRRDCSYLFSPTAQLLAAVPHSAISALPLVDSDGLPVESVAATSADYSDYVSVTADALCYLFETPFGSADADTPQDERGYVLEITYELTNDGGFGGTSVKRIYLPPIDRNTCCRIWCRIPYDGLVFVHLEVDDWIDTPSADIAFDYPNFEFMPYEDPADPTFNPYATEVHYSAANPAEGAVRFNFVLTKGTAWIPSLEGYAQAFQMTVYEKGHPESIVTPPVAPSDKTYTIEIAAVRGIETYKGEGLPADTPTACLFIRTKMWNLQNYKTLDINTASDEWPRRDPQDIDNILITQGANY